MHTQSYKAYLAYLEASAISNTNVDVDVLLLFLPVLSCRQPLSTGSLVKALQSLATYDTFSWINDLYAWL